MTSAKSAQLKINRTFGWSLLAALLALWLPLAPAWADDVAVPMLGARVTDLTGTLTDSQTAALEQKLAAFEQQKGSQVAVLIVPTTQPETIDQYSIRVVDAWKLGRKKVDDGALLLIAKNDHQLRIEVGYGLEGALPDAIANRIIDETITPYFKSGNFYGGIDAGITQMMSVIQGEPLPPPVVRARQGGGSNVLGTLLAPFFILFAIGHVLRRLMGTGPASALVGAGTGLAAFFILGSLALAVGAGFFAIVAALALYSGAVGGMPYMGGGFGGGGFGGGGFGGGGGFSGGGGGFGGGGASGSW